MKTRSVLFAIILLLMGLSFPACDDGGGGSGGNSGLVDGKEITRFMFEVPAAEGEIDAINHTITVPVPYGTVVTALAPTITHTGVDIYPASGAPQDFSGEVVYTVTAADSTTRDYTVTVVQGAAVETHEIADNPDYVMYIAGSSARGGGEVTYGGASAITGRGLCWNTAGSPTIAGPHASDGSGTGEFTEVSLSGLTPGTVYYVRAYATNDEGTVYGSEVSFDSGRAFGNDYRGGLVFYNDGAAGGMVATDVDLSTGTPWVNADSFETADFIETGATDTAAGAGFQNTLDIINAQGEPVVAYAAYLARSCADGEYDDWFLPSKDELNLMYLNLHVNELGGFEDGFYWSSSEVDANDAWCQDFTNGNQYPQGVDIIYKSDYFHVRAVRAFAETEQPDASLASLSVSIGQLDPVFDPYVAEYSVTANYFQTSISIAATSHDSSASLAVNGTDVGSDEDVALSLNIGSNTIAVKVTAADGVTEKDYTITVTRESLAEFVQNAYVKASTNGSGDYFGRSVAVSGDTIVVGAPYESSNATGVDGNEDNNSSSSSGAAYVFVRDGDTWTQQAYLKASNTGASDYFGSSVAIDGDTVVVGAPYEDSSATGIGGSQSDNSATDGGAVYVFVRNGETWSQQAYVKASNAEAGDYFGMSVAVHGDTIVVGAPYEDSSTTGIGGNQADNSSSSSGAVYVFTRSGTTWSQQAYVKASNTGASDHFGYSVSVYSDSLVVGAPDESSSATGIGGNQTDNTSGSSGAVYVFTRSGATWSQQAYVKASNTGSGDLFGYSVSLYDDYFAAGAPMEDGSATGVNGISDDGATNSGAAYVFARNLSVWAQQAYVKASNTGPGDQFGYSVSLYDDYLAVGASGEDSSITGINGASNDGATNSGAAYALMRSGTSWTQRAFIKASNTEANDNFGYSVAVSEGTIVIGAYAEDSSATGIDGNASDNTGTNSGAAYVFE